MNVTTASAIPAGPGRRQARVSATARRTRTDRLARFLAPNPAA